LAQGFNCHNQYVETTLATGFLGLFFLLLMLIVYGKIAIQNKDWLSLSTLLFFAMSMLTESMFERAWAVLLFTFYFPLMLFSGTKSNA
jgi:O-antigen ligase